MKTFHISRMTIKMIVVLLQYQIPIPSHICEQELLRDTVFSLVNRQHMAEK